MANFSTPIAYVANSASNIYTPPSSPFTVRIQHIHLCNTDSSGHTVTLYKGATGASVAGTELFKDLALTAKGSAGSTYDYYCDMAMLTTDFLVGICDAASKVTIIVEGI